MVQDSPTSCRTAADADGPFRLDAPVDWAEMRAALERAGFTESTVRALISAQTPTGAIDRGVLRRRTAESTPLHTLVQLFVAGEAVEEPAVAAALAPLSIDALAAAGVLTVDDGRVRAAAMLVPLDKLLTVRDFGVDVTGGPMRSDQVPPVGISSLLLASFTVRRGGERALDVGTGSGIQALLAARHAQHVVATDTSPRALNFTAFSARLNGFANVEVRHGSLLEPVAGELFDLVVCNPPFVISPESRLVFRDSAMPGDELCERLVRGAPQHLNEGGFACILFNWHHGHADDWSERPHQWLRSSDCDAWLIRFRTSDPLSYAAQCGRESLLGLGDSDGAHLDAWLAYYDRLGIGAISSGALLLRKRAGGSNWRRMQTLRDVPGHYSGQIQRIFAAEDLLGALANPDDLLSRRFQLVPEHRLDQALCVQDGQWRATASTLRQTDGFDFSLSIDPVVGALLALCDGRRTLAEAAAEAAAQLRLDPQRLAADSPAVIVRLLRAGYLTY